MTWRLWLLTIGLVAFFGTPPAILAYYMLQPMPKPTPPDCIPQGYCRGIDEHGRFGYWRVFTPTSR